MNSNDLHKKFYGNWRDKFLYEEPVYEFTGTLIETKIYTLISQENALEQKLVFNENTFGKGIGISNVRMTGELLQIVSVYVSFGGEHLQRLTRLDLIPNEDIFSYLKTSIIPLVRLHNFEISIVFSVPSKIEILVDVMKITNMIDQEYISILLKDVLEYHWDNWNDTLVVKKGYNEINFHEYSPTSKIIIVTKINFHSPVVRNAFLNLDDIKLPFHSYFKKVADDIYECEFEPTINFSNISNHFISFDYDEDYDNKTITTFFYHKPRVLRVSFKHEMYGFVV